MSLGNAETKSLTEMLTSRVRNIEFENAESLDYSLITNYDGQGLCERIKFNPNPCGVTFSHGNSIYHERQYHEEYISNDGEKKRKDNIIREIILPWADSKGWVETKDRLKIDWTLEIKRPKNIEVGRKQSSSSRFTERSRYALMNLLCCCTRPCHKNNSHT